MPLDFQLVSVPFAQGMNTKTDPKQVTSEYLLVQNALYETIDQLNLRSGFLALSNATYQGGTITAGLGIASLNQALLEHDGAFAYARTSDLTDWTQVGQKQAVTITRQAIGSFSSPSFVSVGMARASNGLELYVWLDRNNLVWNAASTLNGTAYYSVFDTINNVTLTSGSLGTTYRAIRADVVGSSFFISATDGTKIVILKEPIATPNFSSATVTTVDAAASVNLIDSTTGPSAVYILGAKVYRVDAASLAVTSSAAATYGPPPNAGITYDAIQNTVWVSNYSGANVQAAVLSSTLTVMAALQTVLAASSPPTGGALSLYASNNQGYIFAPSVDFNVQLLIAATLSSTIFTNIAAITLQSNGQVVSKPTVMSDGFLYWAVSYLSSNNRASAFGLFTPVNPIQPTSFLLKMDPAVIFNITGGLPQVAAKFLALETGVPYCFLTTSGGSYSYVFYSPNSLIQIDATNYEFPSLQTTQDIALTSFTNLTNIMPTATVVKTNFQFGTKFHRDSLANNIHTSGGFISSYDENIEVEHAFHLYPEITATGQVVSTFGVPIGSYSYTAIYRWNDSLGQIHRSAPATPVVVPVTSNNTIVQLAISGLALTDKPNYYVDIYRTAASGTIFFFVRSILVARGGHILNGTDYSDQSVNGVISTLELYDTGGEVDNISAPATQYMVDFKNRLFIIPSEEPYSLWYSKQVIPNFPVEFAQEFVMNLEARGGPATALAPLDDKLIIFKQNAIFYIVGDGPAPSGANNDFSYPQIVPTDSGCIEPDSVVGFPGGVCYKGSKGIYLMDRSLAVSYIGAPVEAYNQYKITSATLDYNLQIIRYTLSNGISLIYDYYVQKWSIFTNISAVDSVVCNGVYYYLGANGIVQQETPGVYSDNGSVISIGLLTGWLSFAKIQAFERVRKLLLLGVNNTASSLTVTFAYDFNPTVFQSTTITNAAVVDPWQYLVQLQRQKCETLQIGFTVTPTAVGKGLSLSGLLLEVGVKRGPNKMAAGVRTG